MRIAGSVLSAGLRVVGAAIAGVRAAEIAAIVRTGADQERDAEAGTVHCLDPMAFEGTARRWALDITREAEVLGARIGAFAGRERTVCCVSGLARRLGAAAGILGDILPLLGRRGRTVEGLRAGGGHAGLPPRALGTASAEMLAGARGGRMSSPLFQEAHGHRGIVCSVAAAEMWRIAEGSPTRADLERARNAPVSSRSPRTLISRCGPPSAWLTTSSSAGASAAPGS
jgi:hypothetical protein